MYFLRALILLAVISTICSGQYSWQWQAPLPQGYDLNAITYGGVQFVAVGEFGTIVTSDDGVLWKFIQIDHEISFYSIIWGGDKFVAVGFNWTTQTAVSIFSNDGKSWTISKIPISLKLKSIAYGDNLFAAAGDDGTIITSNDGLNWKQQISGTKSQLSCITFSNNRFVSVGFDTVIVTSTNGIDWTTITGSFPFDLKSITYSNEKFVAVGYKGKVLTSEDGLAWIAQLPGIPKSAISITYNNGYFLAMSEYGTAMKSIDGITWDSTIAENNQFQYVSAIKTSAQCKCVAAGKGTIVAVGAYGIIVTSPDGKFWERRTTGIVSNFESIAYGNGKFVSVGYNGIVATSSKGKVWIDTSIEPLLVLNYITYINNSFIAVKEYSDRYYTSPDGINWIRKSTGSGQKMSSITYGNGIYVAVCWGGVVLTSTDGIVWTDEVSATSINQNNLIAVHFAANRFVAVGAEGTIISSTDGSAWVRCYSSTTYPLVSLTYGQGKFIAIGDNGCIVTSQDGVTWHNEFSGTNEYLRDVICVDSLFVVVGWGGTVLCSPDGSTWTEHSIGLWYLKSIAYGAGVYVIAGGANNMGVLLTSSEKSSSYVHPTVQNKSTPCFKIQGSWPGTTFFLDGKQSEKNWRLTFSNLSGRKTYSCNAILVENILNYTKPQLTSGIYTVVINNSLNSYKARLKVLK